MSGVVRSAVFGIFVVLILALMPTWVPLVAALDPARTAPSDSPAAQSGKMPKVFISNMGSIDDVYTGMSRSSSDGGSEALNRFYAAMQSSGQYKLVGAPSDAELVFEILYVNLQQTASELRDKPGSDDKFPPQESVEYTIDHPQMHLVIVDARTLAVQGTFTELIRVGRPKDRDKAFAAAIHALVNDADRLLGRPLAGASVPGSPGIAPVPPQIAAARTVFISNAAGPGIFGGTPSTDQAYNEFYAMMQSFSGYQLSPTPAGADLIFEVSENLQFRLAIIDPHTSVTLWAFPSEATTSMLKSNSQKNFDRMLVSLLQNIRKLTGRPAVAISVPQGAKTAPIPPQIAAARTIFIANGGEDSLGDGKGKIENAYNDFYATMKMWGGYELTPTPSQADLVFQISLAGSDLQLEILDFQTHAVLWELTQNIPDISGGTVRHDDFTGAIAALVKRTVDLSGRPAAEISVPAGTHIAPVPPGIGGSAKIFLSKPRSDSPYLEKLMPGRLYSQCYAAMKTWGKYELTATPAEADLIFEPSASGLRIRLTIRDAKTHHVSWTLTQPVKYAFLSGNATKNYIDAIGLLMDDMRGLAALHAQS